METRARDLTGDRVTSTISRSPQDPCPRTNPQLRPLLSDFDDALRGDVDDLLSLDLHPALEVLTDHYIDERWRRAQVLDRNEHARAANYLDLLDERERSRRAETAHAALSPAPGDVETPPQECPVCGHETLASTDSDDFGYGITAGTCLVCSYQRSADIAYDLGRDMEWEQRWADA